MGIFELNCMIGILILGYGDMGKKWYELDFWVWFMCWVRYLKVDFGSWDLIGFDLEKFWLVNVLKIESGMLNIEIWVNSMRYLFYCIDICFFNFLYIFKLKLLLVLDLVIYLMLM